MTFKNPRTRMLPVTFGLYDSPEHAVRAINIAGKDHDWARHASLNVEDERVLWTIEEDHITLYYRESEDQPLLAGGG